MVSMKTFVPVLNKTLIFRPLELELLPTPIESFPFPFPPISIPILAATIMVYLRAEKYVYCVVNQKQNMKLQQKHC